MKIEYKTTNFSTLKEDICGKLGLIFGAVEVRGRFRGIDWCSSGV